MPTGTLHLDDDVRAVDGVSARVAATLARVFDIHTVRDLIEHYPAPDRYRDVGAAVPLAEATVGEPITVIGHVVAWSVGRLLSALEALLDPALPLRDLWIVGSCVLAGVLVYGSAALCFRMEELQFVRQMLIRRRATPSAG